RTKNNIDPMITSAGTVLSQFLTRMLTPLPAGARRTGHAKLRRGDNRRRGPIRRDSTGLSALLRERSELVIVRLVIRVFLLDDHEVVRRGVRELLEECDDIEVVGEAGTAEEALARIPPTRPDV